MLVRGLLIIIKQKKISWWPKIGVVYSKGAELRKMFSDTMQSVTMMMNPNRVAPPPVWLLYVIWYDMSVIRYGMNNWLAGWLNYYIYVILYDMSIWLVGLKYVLYLRSNCFILH